MLLSFFVSIELVLTLLPNGFTAKSSYVEAHLNDIKILMLGHSHAENGFVPSEIGDSVFNFAIGGRHIKYDAQLAEKYVPHMANLKAVLYPVAYNFQNVSYDHICMEDNKEWLNAYNLVPTFHCMYYKYYGLSYNRCSFLYWSELLNSKLNFWARFVGSESDLPQQIDFRKGYFALPEKQFGWEKSQLAFEVNYDSPELTAAYNENVACLTRLADVCERHHIKLILVSFPVYATFMKRVTMEGLRSMRDYVNEVVSKHSNVSYFEYINDKRFDEDDFFNASHLSDRGAHKFSRILKSEVIEKEIN